MPIIRFYELTSPRFRGNPLLLAAKLAERAFEQQQACAIFVDSAAEAEKLDELLWSFDEEAYLPHQIAGQDDDDECPILILSPEFEAPLRAVSINLRDQIYVQIGERLLDIIPEDEAGKHRARERFKGYRARGENPSFEKV
jgi:DNA polymerase III subunit chi